MELLRIKAFQPFVCYRKPFSYGFWDTYPLPPFSTILGWVHWVLGESEREDKLPMNIGVAGQFDTITHDLQTLIKFDRKRKKEGEIVLEDFNKALSSTPTYVANVTNIHLRIFLEMKKECLEKFKDKVLQINYPSLGRYEDLMRIDEVDFIEPEKQKLDNFNPANINYSVYLDPITSEVTGQKGSNFQLPFYHELVNRMRFFEKEKVVYTDTATLNKGEHLFDTDTDDMFQEPIIIQLFGKYSSTANEVLR